MAVEITETDHDTIVVNGKEIYKDANSNWIARSELTPSESIAFSDYIKSKSNNGITENGNNDTYYLIY